MSSSIFRDLAMIREREEREDLLLDEMLRREEERMKRERPWSPEQIIYESEWLQGFGEEAKAFIGYDKGQYYCAFTRSPADDEEFLVWDGPYETKEIGQEKLNQSYQRWDDRLAQKEMEWEAREIAKLEKGTLQAGDKIRLEKAQQESLNLELGLQQEIAL